MSCESIEPELIGFHFATLAPEERAPIEEHLLGCSACLRSYLALKRDLELGESEPAPSAAARERLRRAIATELAGGSAVPWRRWERPFAFGFAAAALMLAMLTVHGAFGMRGAPPRAFARPAQVGR